MKPLSLPAPAADTRQAPTPSHNPEPAAAAAEAAPKAEAAGAAPTPSPDPAAAADVAGAAPPAAAAAAGLSPAWDALGPEILQQILQQIPPRSPKAPPGLCIPSTTCRAWRAAAGGCRRLHVVFSYGLWHQGHWCNFLEWVKGYGGCIQRLEVRLRWAHVEDARLQQLVEVLEAAAAAAGGGGGSSGRNAGGGGSAAPAAAAGVGGYDRNSSGDAAGAGSAAAAAVAAAAAAAAAGDASTSSSGSSSGGLPVLPHLQEVSFAITGPSVWSMPLAARLLRLAPNLSSFDLAVNVTTMVDRSELQALCAALSSHSRLTRLSLQVVNVEAQRSWEQQQGSVRRVLAALPPKLEQLMVTGWLPGPDPTSDDRQLDVSALTHLKCLRELHLEHNRLGSAGALAALPALTSITLDLTHDTLQGLAPVLGKVRCVTYLPNVSPGEFTALTALTRLQPAGRMDQLDFSTFPQLQQVHLDVTDPMGMAAALRQCRALTGLTSLHVTAVDWDDMSAPVLAALTQLKELTLWADSLSRPAPWAEAVKELTGLERLTMHQELLEHGGAWLTGLTALTWLELHDAFPVTSRPGQVLAWVWSSGSDSDIDEDNSSSDGESSSASDSTSSSSRSSGRNQEEQPGEDNSSSSSSGGPGAALDAPPADMAADTAGALEHLDPAATAAAANGPSNNSSSGQVDEQCTAVTPAAAGAYERPPETGSGVSAAPGDAGGVTGSLGGPGDAVPPSDAPEASQVLPCMLLEGYAVAHVAAWLGEAPEQLGASTAEEGELGKVGARAGGCPAADPCPTPAAGAAAGAPGAAPAAAPAAAATAATAAATAATAAATAATAAAAVPGTGDRDIALAMEHTGRAAATVGLNSSGSGRMSISRNGVSGARRVVLHVSGWLEEEDVVACAAALALLRQRLPQLEVSIEGFDL